MAMERGGRRQSGYVPLRDAIDQLFEGSFITPHVFGGGGGFPPADLYITDDNVEVDMAVPGANPDDINISVTGDTVTVSGEVRRHREGQGGQAYFQEVWSGKFQRSFTLPIQVDANKAEATFEHGILTLTLPKSEATKPRKIQVRAQGTIQGEASGAPQSGGSSQTQNIPVEGAQ
jgi:HSP20 family protein